MWLRVVFADIDPPLLVAVGKDGNLYFVAREVARFLGYDFCFSSSTERDLIDLIPDEFVLDLQRRQTAGDRLVLDFEQAIRIMLENSQHRTREEILSLRDLWYRGFVSNKLPEKLPFESKRAFLLEIRREGRVSVRNWMQEYVDATLSIFEFRYKEDGQIEAAKRNKIEKKKKKIEWENLGDKEFRESDVENYEEMF